VFAGSGTFRDASSPQVVQNELDPAARHAGVDIGNRSLILFDRGDVAWLRGYCHLLMAFGECYLAHDGKELFAGTASRTIGTLVKTLVGRGDPKLMFDAEVSIELSSGN